MFSITEKYDSIIIETDALDIRNFGTDNPALAFWNDIKEDIYQDHLPIATQK